MLNTAPKKTRTSWWRDPADEDAIRIIKARYLCSSDSDAIRLALHWLASVEVTISSTAQVPGKLVAISIEGSSGGAPLAR